ncbi:MAG TPA: sensor histidine kinase KdpD [Bryobacteraceae bacterium]|nr:sensor histidine kinase KdpD [Bryobacteraceae bacterium]
MAEATKTSGRLKTYLGYAAGVGKTYQMLEEGQQLKAKGVDVVIGYFEPHGRQDTIARTEGLEIVPRQIIEYRGARFDEMDTPAILWRRPEVCLVDELAHTNVPGSERAKRWEDVIVLLDAGIDIITTMNVQHLESLNDQVWQITGIRVRETLPDWVLKQADEVVMVDLPPAALLNRLARGAVYAPDKAERALQYFFKESNLVALREIALRQTAHEVDLRQPQVPGVPDHDAPKAARAGPAAGPERILVHITPDANTAILLRRARRVADYLRADCLAVHIAEAGDSKRSSAAEREALAKHLNFARHLHVETRVLDSEDAAEALVNFARSRKVTQIYMARPRYSLAKRIAGNFIHRVVRLAGDMQVIIVAEHRGR